jgi:hypothetical protein
VEEEAWPADEGLLRVGWLARGLWGARSSINIQHPLGEEVSKSSL